MSSRAMPRPTIARALLASALVVAVLGASGCGWFRKGNALYAEAPENRPLEVPPDLDRPDTSGAMKMPVAGSVTRSGMSAPAAAAGATAATAATGETGFNVAGERDAVFERVGEVIGSTPGATVVSKAQILGTYDVDFEGAKFLVRVTRVDAGAYVSAVDPRGLPAAGEAPRKLMLALRNALGA
jgi:uncharacterized lipoprotein